MEEHVSLSARISAVILLLIGIVLAGGGAQLTILGGSWYYLLTGVALIAAAWLMWRGRKSGLLIYGAVIAATIIWALWEVGLDGWALMPRLAGPFVLGLWLCTPWVRRGLR